MLQTDICSDVGSELNDFADRLVADPPRVARLELASALKRLAKRCMDGVRRASCRSLPDAAIVARRAPATTAGTSTGHTEATPSTAGTLCFV